MNYIPLRVKTSYSFLKSLNDIKKMVSYCKEKGIEACAICDCNMFGVMEFYKECIKNDIKPIIGMELTIDNGFVILYAKNYAGYQNLTRITYAMQDTPINLDILRKYCSDLICVTNLSIDFYDDIYYGYTNSKDRDLNKKCVYVPEILCLEKDDIKYLKYLAVSETISLRNKNRATKLGSAIKPFKISARTQTTSKVIKAAEATIKMVTDSIDAYVKQDLQLAKSVSDYDDVVDDAFDRVKQTLIRMITENTADGEYALDLLMIAKYFERIGDHAVNIAEWVEFSVTGVHKGE